MKNIYVKEKSFVNFVSLLNNDAQFQKNRAVAILKNIPNEKRNDCLNAVLKDLQIPESQPADFRWSTYITDELSKTDDKDVPFYLIHRYRYDVFPKKQILDDYPPYLQIEPASICNYRCSFCYQTDSSFSDRKNGFMGFMALDLFKEIVDQVTDNVQFISIASRGEPLLCKDIDEMLGYCIGKFLGLKVNTNASVLNEKLCHALLCGGVNTLVFSVDVADKALYERYRKGGNFDKVFANIRLFQEIRKKHYPQSKIITRLSGVKIDKSQNIKDMVQMWGGFVDQISFVDYNPWENIYRSPSKKSTSACSDLWRRMFVWYDGSVNPCDSDYKSMLSVGNVKENTIHNLWHSPAYQKLRALHQNEERPSVNPCCRCAVI